MWPMLIVGDRVLVQDPPQMGLIPYKGAVQEFAAAAPDPALGNRVHARRPDVAEHGPDPGAGEDRVECGGEVRAAVADHEPDPIRVVAEVHDQVTGLLSGPRAGWMRGDAEDADAPGRVLYYGEDIGPGAVKQIGCEEVARQDRLGLGAQELRPGCRGSPRRRVDSGVLQDLPCRRRRYLHSEAGQLAVNPAVAPFGVLAGQPEDQGPDVPASGRPAGLAAAGLRRPAAAEDVAVPAQDRVRGDQEPEPPAARFGYHSEQSREQSPVRPVQVRAARLMSLQDRELVAQDQDLGGLPRLLTLGQPQPGGHPRDQKEDEAQAHDR